MSSVKVAAVGDIHLAEKGRYEPFKRIPGKRVDLLLLAGDLTWDGSIDQGAAVVASLQPVLLAKVPVVAVLGNHDCAVAEDRLIAEHLRANGVLVLGYGKNHARFMIKGVDVGVAGCTGFGGGFLGYEGANFGEQIQQDYMTYAEREGEKLLDGLNHLRDCDTRIALTHYAPIPGTVRNEPEQIWPFLGSGSLLEAARKGNADLYLHGHAHKGPFRGHSGNLRVFNVYTGLVQGYGSFFYPLNPGHRNVKGGWNEGS